jgi:hypothetical protein
LLCKIVTSPLRGRGQAPRISIQLAIS